jgi:NTP pyrophosphatase (non-canonical NTP hydrolase)
MQQQSLEEIQMRDQQFDEILDQIGKAVELAGEKAKAINDETQLQNAMLDKLEENIEEVKAKMNTVNVSMKKNLEEKGMGAERFCINCICCVILLGFIGLIVNTVL